jgi:hypothetical protein
MARSRLALSAGILLLIASCLLPCLPLMDMAGNSMPYQDPKPEMVTKQAADISAAQHRLVVAAAIGGVIAIIYARRHPDGKAVPILSGFANDRSARGKTIRQRCIFFGRLADHRRPLLRLLALPGTSPSYREGDAPPRRK